MVIVSEKKRLYILDGTKIQEIKYKDDKYLDFPEDMMIQVDYKLKDKQVWYSIQYGIDTHLVKMHVKDDINWYIQIINLFEKYQNDMYMHTLIDSFDLEQLEYKQVVFRKTKIIGDSFAYCLSTALLENFVYDLFDGKYEIIDAMDNMGSEVAQVIFKNGLSVYIRRTI